MKHIIATLVCILALSQAASAQESILIANNEIKKPGSASSACRIINNEVRSEHHISFVRDKAEMLPGSIPALQTIKKYLDDKDYISLLRIEGHVSCGAGAQKLSEARARAVYGWLVKNGVDCKRIIPVGFGCTKPITDAHNEGAERIVFMNAALNGRPIGGMPVDGGGQVAGNLCE